MIFNLFCGGSECSTNLRDLYSWVPTLQQRVRNREDSHAFAIFRYPGHINPHNVGYHNDLWPDFFRRGQKAQHNQFRRWNLA